MVIGEFTNVDEKTGERDRRSIFDKSFVITENATKKMTKVRDFDDMYFNLEYYRHIKTVVYIHKHIYNCR